MKKKLKTVFQIEFAKKILGKGKNEQSAWKDAFEKMDWNKGRLSEHCADNIQVAKSEVKLKENTSKLNIDAT